MVAIDKRLRVGGTGSVVGAAHADTDASTGNIREFRAPLGSNRRGARVS